MTMDPFADRDLAGSIAQSLAHATGAGVAIVDADGIRFADERLARLTEFAVADLIGRPFSAFAHPDSRAVIERWIHGHLTGDSTTCQGEVRLATRSGRIVWGELSTSSVVVSGQTCVLAVVLDVTDRKRTVDAWTVNDELYRELFDQDPNGRLVADTEWRIIDCNGALADLLGLEAVGQLIGRRLTDFCPDQPALNRLLATVRSEGKTSGVAEIEMARVDGSVVRLGIALNGVFDQSGMLSVVCGLLFGASEAMQMKARLLAQHRMEAIGRLAGGIAHDFNNLLTVMGGHSDRLVDALTADAALQNSAWSIRQATRRAASITRQLLAFSRRQVFQLSPVALNRLVDDARPSLEDLAGEKIRLRLDLPARMPEILGDPVQIEQVLASLVMNARESAPSTDRITIRLDTLTIDQPPAERPWLTQGDYVRVVVSDNGPGMDAVTRTHLFEPFFTTKQLGQGSGLALASAYGIVKQSDGFIWADSEVGKGTSFTILFPIKGAQGTQVSRQRPSSFQTVLVAEDDENLRTLIAVSLRIRGYHVLDAPSTERALEIVAAYTSRVHLLVTDVKPGTGGGPSLAEQLKAQEPRLQVLFMPGSGNTERAAIAGQPLLQKPFTVEALVDRVRVMLDPARGRGQTVGN